MSRPPLAHRVTTAHLCAAYPFVAEGGLPPSALYVGQDLFGAGFSYDPWALYAQKVLTGTNAVVLGLIGRGKSALVKTLLARAVLLGVHGVAFDVKGEYGPLAQAFGVEPLRLAPGGTIRLNPLDPRTSERDQAALVEALAATALDRTLRPEERTALEVALTETRRRNTEATLPAVVAALLDPAPQAARHIPRTTVDDLAHAGRQPALELRRLCEGPLAGMFDGPTSRAGDFHAPLVVVDLSAVYHSTALPLVMTCVAAWLQGAIGADISTRRMVVLDEAWRMFSNVAIAAWMQESFKLSRALGVSNVLVMHRLSDLAAAGAAGSHQVRLVEGLLADAETRVVYAQAPSEVARCRELLGLTDTEAAMLPDLPRGQALWKIAGRSFLVEHRLTDIERRVVDTDHRRTPVGSPPSTLAA